MVEQSSVQEVKDKLKAAKEIRDLLEEEPKNVLPDYWKKFMEMGRDETVEIVLDRARGQFAQGMIQDTADSSEREKTGLDVVWSQYSQVRKEHVIMRRPLSMMRHDEIRLLRGGNYAKTSTTPPTRVYEEPTTSTEKLTKAAAEMIGRHVKVTDRDDFGKHMSTYDKPKRGPGRPRKTE